MADVHWGLLGPEKLSNTRRTRTLGIGAAVRAFNDLAVPGLGGVWFGKQLFLATLGVAVAEQVRNDGKPVQNIETANAIEALACWLALDHNEWKSAPRLRGATKLLGKRDLSFATVRKRGFYVTQPMRMTTVQPLRALGFVASASERFGTFSCSDEGSAFIEAACSESNPCHYSKSVSEYLADWAWDGNIAPAEGTQDKLRGALSPLIPLPKSALELLRERLVLGADNNAKRRRSALQWVEELRDSPLSPLTWDTKPALLADDHWKDLRAGAKFFLANDAAIALLDRVEAYLASQSAQRLSLQEIPKTLDGALELLRHKAQAFLGENHDPTQLAGAFCRECIDTDSARLLAALVKRDDRVLRLRGNDIVPGPAFRGQAVQAGEANGQEEEDTEAPAAKEIRWPPGISRRIRNLFLLNLDLNGELDQWLSEQEIDAGGRS
jgi:hypothetical protein